MRAGFLSKWSAIAAVAILVAVEAAAVNYLGRNNYLPEGSEHWTEDWLIHYFSPRLEKPYDNIAIVAVDPESLEKAAVPETIPVDRGWMAKLITAASAQAPAAIGIDFYFTSPIDPVKDELLTAAIRDARAPIVIAAVDDMFLRTEKSAPSSARSSRPLTGLPGTSISAGPRRFLPSATERRAASITARRRTDTAR